MDVRVQADAVAVGRALIAALLFVGKRAASFSEAKFDDSVFGSVLRRRRTHWTFLYQELRAKAIGSTITSTNRSLWGPVLPRLRDHIRLIQPVTYSVQESVIFAQASRVTRRSALG